MIANIGALNKKVDVIAGQTGKYRGFSAVKDVVIHKGIWAAVQPVRGKEYYEHKITTSDAAVKITVRYRDTINTGCKIVYRGHTYDIESVVDPDMTHEILELYCTEKQRGAVNQKAVGV